MADLFEICNRVQNLSLGHHYEVASFGVKFSGKYGPIEVGQSGANLRWKMTGSGLLFRLDQNPYDIIHVTLFVI